MSHNFGRHERAAGGSVIEPVRQSIVRGEDRRDRRMPRTRSTARRGRAHIESTPRRRGFRARPALNAQSLGALLSSFCPATAWDAAMRSWPASRTALPTTERRGDHIYLTTRTKCRDFTTPAATTAWLLQGLHSIAHESTHTVSHMYMCVCV